MLNNRIVPKPWCQVSLTILPGLLLLMASEFQNARVVSIFSTVAIVTMLLVAFGVAVQRRALSKLPVWGIIPLGYLVFLFSGFCVDSIFSGRSVAIFINPHFLVYMSLPIATGLFLAREHGLIAGLIIIPAGVTLMTFDIEHVIYFWDAEAWSRAISLSVPLLFYVMTPLWVLRSRSILGQAAGLLVPSVVYYLVLVFALVQASVISPARGSDLSQAFSIAQPAVLYFVTMAIVAGLYGWVSQQNRPSGDQTPPSALNSI